MLLTAVEFMFYNNNIDTGIIYTYFFFHGNTGNLVIDKDVSVFLPNNYSAGYSLKLTCIIAVVFFLIIITIQLGITLRLKLRSLIVNRFNEFFSTDLLTIL